MPSIRLVPSTYYLSSTYLTVENASNMYTNTDSSTYGTITNTRQATTTYYAYLRDFNFQDVPANVKVTSFTIKIRISATGHTTSTSSSYKMSLATGTSAISNSYANGTINSTLTTFTFDTPGWTWTTLTSYNTFGIRIPLKRNNSSVPVIANIYGAEILVEYELPKTIITTLSGDGTISPEGTTLAYNGDQFTLLISPTASDDVVHVTDTYGGTANDVTNQLISRTTTSANLEEVLGAYTLVSNSFNGSGGTYFSGLVGKGVNSATTTSNYYSSASNTIVVFTYDMEFTNIPDGTTIERVWCEVNGHPESTTSGNEYMCVKLISGNTSLTEEFNFKSTGITANSTQTIECETIPTLSQLASMKLQCRLGYYGGAINGATCYVQYSVPSDLYYTYTVTVSSDHTINVQISPLSFLYLQTDLLEPGKEYVFVGYDHSASKYYLFLNELHNNGLKLLPLNNFDYSFIDLDSTTRSRAIFTTTSSEVANAVRLKISNSYLQCSGNGTLSLTNNPDNFYWYYKYAETTPPHLYSFQGTNDNRGYYDDSSKTKYYFYKTSTSDVVNCLTASQGTTLANTIPNLAIYLMVFNEQAIPEFFDYVSRKDSAHWTNDIKSIYKKINGEWIRQTSPNCFDSSRKHVIGQSTIPK